MKKILLTALLIGSFSAFAEDAATTAGKPAMDPAKKEQLKEDREAINKACTSESSTAGCGNEKVGTGLLKCIHAYKKEHKQDFKISDGCKTAMQKLHGDKMNK